MSPETKITLSTPKLRTSNLKEGTNVLRQTPQFTLVGDVKRGKLVSLSATDPKGTQLAVSTLRQTVLAKPGAVAAERIKCYACVLTPGGLHCYEISCDDLPKKKTPPPSKQ